VDVFLDLSGTGNDIRFDFSSAISNSSGGFLRDFAFNFGFYNSSDNTGPGAGTDRFIVSASNNTGRGNSFPKNPGRDPIAITQSGWYTLQHHFYDNAGVLNVDLIILDSLQSVIHSWTLGGDPISGVGGNRYGWIASNEFSSLAIDNSYLDTVDPVPEPSTMALFGLGFAGLAIARRRRS
jgi:hypothetical protein